MPASGTGAGMRVDARGLARRAGRGRPVERGVEAGGVASSVEPRRPRRPRRDSRRGPSSVLHRASRRGTRKKPSRTPGAKAAGRVRERDRAHDVGAQRGRARAGAERRRRPRRGDLARAAPCSRRCASAASTSAVELGLGDRELASRAMCSTSSSRRSLMLSPTRARGRRRRRAAA